MNKQKRILLMLFLFLLAVWAITWLVGCTVTKTKSSEAKDSTATHKETTAAVSRQESASKTNTDWWREIINFPGRRDTMLQQVLQPVNNYNTLPIQYIREGGTSQQETSQYNFDSFSNAVQDSINAKLSRTEKHKEVEVLSWWQILLLGAGGGLAIVLFSKFKITRR